MSANNSSSWTSSSASEDQDYTCVRFYVSTASFSVLLFFNLIINWTIVGEERLRTCARYVLVFHLLVSALIYLGMSSVFYYQIHLVSRPGRSTCLFMVTVLISSASNTLLTLTVMAVDRYCAVCHPMRYSATCTPGHWPWLLGLLTWLLALLIPLSLLLQPDSYSQHEEHCGPDQLRVGVPQKMVFISCCTALILYTYVRILMEGRRLGVLNRRNRTGRRTIALHGTQLGVYILPNFVNFGLTTLHQHGLIQSQTKELSAVVNFAFFSLAQCVAPIVYGLHKQELMDQLSQRFPCCSRYLKNVLGWTMRASWQYPQHRQRERTLTAVTIISQEVPQTLAEEQETRPDSDSTSSQDSHSGQGDTNNEGST